MEGTYKLADDTTGKCGLRLKEEEGGRGEGSQHNGLNIKYKSVFQIEGNLVGTFDGTHGGRKEICLPFTNF